MIFQSSFYKSKKILLTEDCEPVRSAVKGMLQQIGFEDITAVADAAQAMTQSENQVFDFVIADFLLGNGKDALQLFDELKQQRCLKPGSCFAIISAEPQIPPLHGLMYGLPDCFLLKPFTYVELEKRLARAWQSKTALRKVYQALAHQDLVLAGIEIDETIKNTPLYALPALRLKGEVLLAQHENQAAMQLYQQICQQRDFAWARLGKAIALFKLASFAEAETALQALLQTEETRTEALYWLTRLYVQQKKLPQAIPSLQELVKTNARNISYQHCLALLWRLDGHDDEAVKQWHKLIQQYRFSAFDQPAHYLELARLLLEQSLYCEPGQFYDAVKKAADVLEVLPQRLMTTEVEHQLLILTARINLLNGNMADARFQMNEHEVVLPDDVSGAMALMDKARLMFSLGELKKVEYYQQKLRARLTLIARHDTLFMDCVCLLAEQYFERLEQKKKQLRELNNSALADIRQQDFKKALLKFRQAFILMPFNGELALNLLYVLGQLPPHKALITLAQSVQATLAELILPATHQQRLDDIRQQLPELYRYRP